ncbi:MAG: TolC family protein [Candidatus Omnitrophica bacterium]|nr:TolC family protein [Candidatus Omnitrophota bacterium]MCB9721910.1 TolC family protein [Candidatus Omnitrophota bacterium]
MIRKICALVCLFVLVCTMAATASVSELGILSLEEALELAWKNNPRMGRARLAIESARGEHTAAKSWPEPSLEFEIGGLKKGTDGSRKAHLDTIALKQPFNIIGTRRLQAALGKNEIVIKEQSLRQVWSEVYVEVRSIYKNLTLIEKELELRRKNLQTMRQFYSDVQVSYQGGQALKNHVQRARIELLKTESECLNAENDRDIAQARLNLLLGRKRDVPFMIENALEEERLAFDLEELQVIASANRPDIQIEQTRLDSSRKELTRQHLHRLPSFALGLEMLDEEYEQDYAILVEISLPLWGLNRGNIRKAKTEVAAGKIAVKAKQDEIDFEVYAAYRDARLAARQLDLHKQSLVEANEMFRLAGLRYGEGHIDFLNYLDQLSASLDSRMRYYQGLYRLSESISMLEKAVHASLREEEYLR